MTEAVLVAARRSAIGRAHKGSLRSIRPDDLAGQVVRGVLADAHDPRVDEVIVGCGYPWGEQGFNVARPISLLSGLPAEVPAYTVSRLCASSLQAVRSAHHAIAMGEATTVVAAGVESVSRVGRDRGQAELNPRLTPDAPGETVADLYVSMIDTAERVADRFGVTRAEMDAFAQSSQMRAVHSAASGFFGREIVPVVLPDGSVVDRDDGPRPTSTLAGLAALSPVEGPDGRVTAVNASPLNDGAAAVVVMEAEQARAEGLTPLARIRGSAVSAVDPTVMGIGPIEATRRLMKTLGITASDVDVLEINEAFAAQVIPVATELGFDPLDERLNPHGGAIALGHPFGMSGVRLVVTALNGLRSGDGSLAIVCMCVGGGQGQALALERIG